MKNKKPFVSVVLPAAGQGTRMKSAQNKLWIPLDGVPLIVYSLNVFIESPCVQEVILVVPPGNIEPYQTEIVDPLKTDKPIRLIEGGARRQDSVGNGVQAISSKCDIVMVHDGARPFVTEAMIEQSVAEAEESGGCVIGVPSKATMKESDEAKWVVRTPPRDRLWEIQTPQTAQALILKKAFEKAEKENLDVTDEGMLLEAMGHSVKIVEGEYTNIKVTTPEDIWIAEQILKKKKEAE